MFYFTIELTNGDSFVFIGDRVPSVKEADSFFRKTIEWKEAIAEAERCGEEIEIQFTEEVSQDRDATLWDLEALEAMGEQWLFFDGTDELTPSSTFQ